MTGAGARDGAGTSAFSEEGTGHYLAYGATLSSTLLLPELHRVPPAPPRWTFDVVADLPQVGETEVLGEEPLYADVSARLERHAEGYLIRVHDTGVFSLSLDGSTIRWKPNPEPWWDFGRAHLLGRVLATSLHLSGRVVLHGSAVEMGSGVVAFLAPKHFGKSTLSRVLMERGARFVTDDSLPVAPPGSREARAMAWPGIQSLRVRKEDLSKRPEGPLSHQGLQVGRDGKINLPPLPLEQVLSKAAPLAAIYLLNPWEPGTEHGAPACEREALPPVPATLFLMGQMKIGAMLGPRFAGVHMDACSAIVAAAPVYRLKVVRDLSRVHQVAEQLEGWHG